MITSCAIIDCFIFYGSVMEIGDLHNRIHMSVCLYMCECVSKRLYIETLGEGKRHNVAKPNSHIP